MLPLQPRFGARIAVRLQYEAKDELRSVYQFLTFHLQICVFLEWSRGDSNP
jgi:hypothetical protein